VINVLNATTRFTKYPSLNKRLATPNIVNREKKIKSQGQGLLSAVRYSAAIQKKVHKGMDARITPF